MIRVVFKPSYILLRALRMAKTPHEKGVALENIVAALFNRVDGFTVIPNVKTKTEEIDLVIRNESSGEFWRKERNFLIVECKNKQKLADKNDYVIFQNKIRNRNGLAKTGFLVSWNGFTKTFFQERIRNSKFFIIPVDGNQVTAALEDDESNIENHIKQWYYDALKERDY